MPSEDNTNAPPIPTHPVAKSSKTINKEQMSNTTAHKTDAIPTAKTKAIVPKTKNAKNKTEKTAANFKNVFKHHLNDFEIKENTFFENPTILSPDFFAIFFTSGSFIQALTNSFTFSCAFLPLLLGNSVS